jgi:hypothetical protein
MTMTSRWRWVSARAVLTNLWLTTLNQLQPTYVRCPEGKPKLAPRLLADQGRNVAEYLAFITGRTRDCDALRWKALCAGFTAGQD